MEFIHLHRNRLNKNSNIFLLLIPAIFFVIVLAMIASHQRASVLGIEAP